MRYPNPAIEYPPLVAACAICEQDYIVHETDSALCVNCDQMNETGRELSDAIGDFEIEKAKELYVKLGKFLEAI